MRYINIKIIPLLAKFFMASTIVSAIKESRPLVGSSQNNKPFKLNLFIDIDEWELEKKIT